MGFEVRVEKQAQPNLSSDQETLEQALVSSGSLSASSFDIPALIGGIRQSVSDGTDEHRSDLSNLFPCPSDALQNSYSADSQTHDIRGQEIRGLFSGLMNQVRSLFTMPVKTQRTSTATSVSWQDNFNPGNLSTVNFDDNSSIHLQMLRLAGADQNLQQQVNSLFMAVPDSEQYRQTLSALIDKLRQEGKSSSEISRFETLASIAGQNVQQALYEIRLGDVAPDSPPFPKIQERLIQIRQQKNLLLDNL
ncbi:MAG: hypothetical protein VKJ04_06380 [Vampirovibrionales bacterium]|nr:hypothetical protein [Vampirovibrionales bacterium]